MDKKIKFSEQPTRVKIIYGVVVAVLCITAIVVGIVGVAARKDNATPLPEQNGADNGNSEGTLPDGGSDNQNGNNGQNGTEQPPAKVSYVSPLVGTIAKSHSAEVPVFSNTLNEWRIHTGIDVSAELGSEVYAVCDGTVSAIYAHPLHGRTVEITHSAGIVSVYSNLSGEGISVNVGDTVSVGEKIGVVGDTSLSELCDEPHLHFEMKVNGVSVNPLDYISEDSKEASLGIGRV
jgi:murein DD-endopeptidase MepM/ murein hydrolase activator NlpD